MIALFILISHKFRRYLSEVGVRSLGYTYPDDLITSNLHYFYKCYKHKLSPYKALLFFGDYLKGNYKF